MSKFLADKAYTMTNENGDLIISFVCKGYNKKGGQMAYEEVKKADKFIIDVKEAKSKRSIEQNNMMWALITKMADALTYTKEELYGLLLRDFGCKPTYIETLKEAYRELNQVYRVVLPIQERKNGLTMLFECYKGSSTFTTKDMAKFIDLILLKCNEFGIYDSEVKTIAEIFHNTK